MKIFISHGQNELAKLKLKEFVRETLNLVPLILADQPSDGLTIVEKLEKYGKQCKFALILLTADDETAGGSLRARQNVIHELGYFHGFLGREKVLLLKEGGIELFSNISGIIYLEFPNGHIETTFEGIRKALLHVGVKEQNKKIHPGDSLGTPKGKKNSIITEFNDSVVNNVVNVQGGSNTFNQ